MMETAGLLSTIATVPDRDAKGHAAGIGTGLPADPAAVSQATAFAGVLLQEQNRATEPSVESTAAAAPTAEAAAGDRPNRPALAAPVPVVDASASGTSTVRDGKATQVAPEVAEVQPATAGATPAIPGGAVLPGQVAVAATPVVSAPAAVLGPTLVAVVPVAARPSAQPGAGDLPAGEITPTPGLVREGEGSVAPALAAAYGTTLGLPEIPAVSTGLAAGAPPAPASAGQVSATPAAAAVALPAEPGQDVPSQGQLPLPEVAFRHAAPASQTGLRAPTGGGREEAVTFATAETEGGAHALPRPAAAQLPPHAAKLWTTVSLTDPAQPTAAAFRQSAAVLPKGNDKGSAEVVREPNPDTKTAVVLAVEYTAAQGAAASAAAASPDGQRRIPTSESAKEAVPAAVRSEDAARLDAPAAAQPAASAGMAGMDRAGTYAGLRQRLEFLTQAFTASGEAMAASGEGTLAGDANATAAQSGRTGLAGATSPGAALTARATVAQQVVAGLQGSAAGERLTLQLNPAELGEIEIKFLGQGDSLQIQITATSREAETAIRESLQDLKDSLGEKSGRFQQVEIKVDYKENQDHRQERRDGERREQAKDQGRPDERADQRGAGSRSRARQSDSQASSAQWANVFREVQ